MLLTSRETLKVVFNPNAGNAKLLSPETIAFYLEQQNLSYEWVTIQDLKKIADKSPQHHPVLVVGGDGTLHGILNAIGYRNLHKFSFAIIPAGTGNDFARSLNIPLNIEKAFQALAEGYVNRVDLGVLNNRICFTCAVSLGFGTEVTKHAPRLLRFLLGRGALYLGALRYLFHPKPVYKIKTRINGQAQQQLQTPHLVIGNAKYHGGGFQISPQADLQNKLLDLYYVKPVTFWNLPRLFYKIFRHYDHTQLDEVTHQQIEEIQVALNEPLEVDVDGDLYTFYRRLDVKVFPAKLNVIMPPPVALQDKLIKDPAWKLVGRNRRAS